MTFIILFSVCAMGWTEKKSIGQIYKAMQKYYPDSADDEMEKLL